MARVTLTPVNLPGPGTAGLTLGSSGATNLAGVTPGIQFSNNGLMFLAIYVGSATTSFTQNFGRTVEGSFPAPVVAALSATTNYLFGPWSPGDFTSRDGTGLTYFDFSGALTGASITLYQLVPVT